MRIMFFCFLHSVYIVNAFQRANSYNQLIAGNESGYFYCSEIYWSSKNHDLQLYGNPIVIHYLHNQFKGKGSATFLENEKAIFLNSKLIEYDKKIFVKGYKCNIKRIDKETVLKKYSIISPNGGVEIQLDSLSQKLKLTKQAEDSLKIKGRFTWKDTSIIGYPPNVKITSSVNPHVQFIQEVDSLGMFEKTLTYGKYIISPELNYHWMGEEFIRIDDQKSTIELEIKADSKNEIIIRLDTISWPKNPFKSGILKTTGEIDYKGIDRFMLERMKFFEIPGAALSIIKDSKIIYNQTYGVTNSNTKKPVTSKTLFEAGSITKLVFAFAVMRLFEKGKIDLDKPLYQYFAFADVDDERYKLITARLVLSHQSGLANWPKKDANGKFKLIFTPGTQYGYSGQAYEYLKEVIESITSKSIDEVLQEEVLEPLQLNDMYFKGNDVIMEHGANGHKKYIPSEILLAKKTMVSYSLQTTSEALAKFAIALNERKGLKKETYDEMFKVHSTREDGTKWGLGVRIEETSSGISYGHSGSTNEGFISNLVFYKDSGLGFTVLTNSQMGGWLSLPLLNEYLILGNPN